MKNFIKTTLLLLVFVGINFFTTKVAEAGQVQFVNNTPPFSGYDLHWYMDEYYQCMAPSGGRTCSREVSEGSHLFKVRDNPNDDAYLCYWDEYIESGSSYTLTYPDDCQ